MMTAAGTQGALAWAWAGCPLASEESGDLAVVVSFGDRTLAAAIDGLGHGYEAALASRAARAVIEREQPASLRALIDLCHEALRPTRGAAMSVAEFRGDSMTWVGVGNVDAVLLRAAPRPSHANETLITRGGVVGYRLPPLRTRTIAIERGDTLIMATDGVRSTFSDAVDLDLEPNQIAERVLAKHQKGTDDALVLAARYLAGGP